MNHRLIKFAACIIAGGILVSGAAGLAEDADSIAPGRKMAQQAMHIPEHWTTADHSAFEILNQPFENGNDITAACLSCHTQADAQFRETIHWTWLSPYDESGETGKAGYSVNNFCISANKMEDKDCSSCHTGWNGKHESINCLLCHSKKDIKWRDEFKDYQYFKETGETEIAGEIQQTIREGVTSIGLPGRRHCGKCHFYGGGGEAVKHGDLDASLISPKKTLDVHMGSDGQAFECTRCHTTTGHRIAGRVYSTPASIDRKSLVEHDLVPKIMCESCHTASPHEIGDKMNDHTDRVACQSCHIPTFAREHPTKMWWDWSKAGKLKDGKPYQELGEFDRPVYKSIKGEFRWEKDVIPEYYWYNGSITTLKANDTIDPSVTVPVSWPVGSRDDANSRIFPFKVHRGKQPYDKVNKNLIAALLSPTVDGYWKTFDWDDAIRRGMDIMGLPYSGELGFVDSKYVFPSTHMVAPKDDAVSCRECHRRENGRMANLSGFYMPGRDYFKLLDMGGWAIVLAAFLGVLVHGLSRIFLNGGKRK